MLIMNEDIKITRLQDNLSSLRKLAGWTAEGLGNQLGVTKQTISNLETKKTPMNKMQYIAIRAVFEKRCYELGENQILKQAIEILVDKDIDDVTGNEYVNIKNGFAEAANAAASGVSVAALKGIINTIIPGAAIVFAVSDILEHVNLSWLELNENKKK